MNYYCSQQRGQSVAYYAGLGVPNNEIGDINHPVSTLAALASVMTAVGDTGYIGPGTYRRILDNSQAVFTFTQNDQTIYADPQACFVIGDIPGKVRITGCLDSEEKPTAGTIISMSGKTGCVVRGHSIDAMLIVDGNSNTTYVITGSSGAPDANTVMFCYTAGWYGVGMCLCRYNIITCVVRGIYNCSAENCIVCASSYGIYTTSGGSYSFTGCLVVGSYLGYQLNDNIVVTITNCIAAFCGTGFRGGADTTLTSCLTMLSGTAATGNSDTDILDVNGLLYLYSAAPTSNVTGVATSGSNILFDSSALIRALQPILNTGLYNLGVPTEVLTDILGKTRGLVTTDIGPWETATNEDGRIPSFNSIIDNL